MHFWAVANVTVCDLCFRLKFQKFKHLIIPMVKICLLGLCWLWNGRLKIVLTQQNFPMISEGLRAFWIWLSIAINQHNEDLAWSDAETAIQELFKDFNIFYGAVAMSHMSKLCKISLSIILIGLKTRFKTFLMTVFPIN